MKRAMQVIFVLACLIIIGLAITVILADTPQSGPAGVSAGEHNAATGNYPYPYPYPGPDYGQFLPFIKNEEP